jgi:hypothetical protein
MRAGLDVVSETVLDWMPSSMKLDVAIVESVSACGLECRLSVAWSPFLRMCPSVVWSPLFSPFLSRFMSVVWSLFLCVYGCRLEFF